MADFKTINTRIALRTGDFAYWTTGAGKDIELIKGEVCVCTVAVGDNQATTAPTVLFKVCDTTGKKFADLKWMSGLAADVYTWAKATKAEHKEWLKTNHADLDTRYSFSTDGDKLVVKKTLYTNGVAGTEEDVGTYEFLTAEEVAKTLEGYYTKNEVDGLIAGVVGNKDTDTKDSNTIAGAKKYTDAAVEGIVSGSGYATQTWVTGEIEKLDKADTAVDGQYVSAVSEENGIITVTRANLPTSADYGVLKVAKGDDTITIGGTDQNPTIAVTANKFDAYGAAAQALVDAKAYADAKPHENTAHTHSVGDGLKKTGDGGIDGDVKYELNLKFGELNDNKLQLLDATNNAIVAEFDAAAFVEDSYLNEVTYKDENSDNILEFTFTLNDGSTKTVDVDLSHLVDVYTADETTITLTTSGDGKVFKVKEAGIETKHIKDGNVTEAKLEKNVTDALALARTAIQAHQDITGKADKVTGAVAGNFAGLDANGNLVDSGKKAGDFDAAGAAATAKEEAIAAAAKDAADKAAVVLGEAQNYADDKVAALAGEGNTTTVKAVADRVKDLEDANHISDVEADTGLKVIAGTNGANNKVAIDETVVFVLDCNW